MVPKARPVQTALKWAIEADRGALASDGDQLFVADTMIVAELRVSRNFVFRRLRASSFGFEFRAISIESFRRLSFLSVWMRLKLR